MDDVEDAILDVWEKIRPRLENDPAEVERRLGRAHSSTLRRPPRVWCLAIRAMDTRIHEASAIITPDKALYPRFNQGRYEKHEVKLDARLLRMLCAPVMIHSMGETSREVAARLGRKAQNLTDARIKGRFSVQHIQGLGGQRGKAVPILRAKGELNPSIRGFEMPDCVWGRTAEYRDMYVPDDVEQFVMRVPHYQRRGPSFRDMDGLHPEHPAVDPPSWPRKSKRLPPPEPDYVWYKWKGDEYVGYDWRNPGAKAGYERHERIKASARAYSKRRGPRPSKSKGSLEFRGWRWVCPACGRRVSVLFHPRRSINVLECYLGEQIEALTRLHPPPAGELRGFACARCHRVRDLSRASRDFWNDVVSCLTGGLLYGSEVPRPAWLKRERKRTYSPRPTAKPAWRRPMVLERLLLGWSYKRIAAEMGIHWHTVDAHARKIYQQHGVHGRYELARALGVKLERPVTKREQVRQRLEAGQSCAQIAREMGMRKRTVWEHVRQLRMRKLAAA